MVSFKKAGIPIPSFSAADVSPCGGESASKAKQSNNKRAPVVTPAINRIAAHWNVASLMQLEVSLQLWFRRRDDPNKKKRMNLEDFFALVQKLDWRQTSTSTTKDNDGKKKKKKEEETEHVALVRNLTVEERLLHDLLCVASGPSMKEPLYNIRFADEQLEPLPHTADQLRRALATTSTLDKAWSEKIVAMFMKRRVAKDGLKKPQKVMAAANKTEEITKTRIVSTKGMTIDERVRAKAKARQQYDQLLQERLEGDPLANLVTDMTWTIQLADALWSHARSVLQRQNFHLPNKLASNSFLHPRTAKRQQTSALRCVMSLRDVIQTISKSRLGDASPVQIAKALSMMEGLSPKWIQVKHGKNKNDNNKKPKSFKWCQKTTTVFMIPDHYPKVRSQLTGQPVPKTTGQTRKIDLRVKTVEETFGQENAANNKRKRTSPVPAKKLIGAFDDTTPADSKRNKLSFGVGKAVRISPGVDTPAAEKNGGRNGVMIHKKM